MRSVVHGVARTLSTFRWVESLHLAAACTMLVMAAALESGARFGDGEAWGLAALCGLAVGGLWWVSHRLSRAALAARLDRRLRHGGALVAAYDAEVSGRVEAEPGPREQRANGLARLLCLRVLARLRHRDAQRAVLPSPALAVVAPLVGVFLLAAANDRREAVSTRTPADPAALAAGLLAALDDARGALREGEGNALEHEELFGLERRARDIAGALRLDPADPEAQRALEALDRDLERQGAREGADADLRRRLETARTWLDGASAAIDAHRSEGTEEGGPPSEPAGGNASPAETAEGGRASGGSAGGNPSTNPNDSPLEGDVAGGTIPEADALPGGGQPLEQGTAEAGRWWPARHDALVERWVDDRREVLEGARGRR